MIVAIDIQGPAEIPDDFAKLLCVSGTVGVEEFVLERPSSEIQSISVVMERWSVEHRAFAVETYLKKKTTILS